MVRQSGFGLLQLMVVLGIIAILGAIAVPQYNKYVTRARVTEALHHAQVYARKVESEAAGGGDAGNPPILDHARVSKTGSGPGTKVCVSLSEGIDSQALIASDDMAEGKVLELTPKGSADAIRWACTSDLDGAFMPKVCTHSASISCEFSGVDKDSDTEKDPDSETEPWRSADDGDACWGGSSWVKGKVKGGPGLDFQQLIADHRLAESGTHGWSAGCAGHGEACNCASD